MRAFVSNYDFPRFGNSTLGQGVGGWFEVLGLWSAPNMTHGLIIGLGACIEGSFGMLVRARWVFSRGDFKLRPWGMLRSIFVYNLT